MNDDHVVNFILHMGSVQGGLMNAQIRGYLMHNGATEAEIGEASRALLALAQAFYRNVPDGDAD